MTKIIREKIISAGFTVALITGVLFIIMTAYGTYTAISQASIYQGGISGVMVLGAALSLLGTTAAVFFGLYLIAMLNGIYDRLGQNSQGE